MRDTVWEQIATEGSVLHVASPIPWPAPAYTITAPRPLARAAPPAVGSRVPARLPPPPPAPTRREQADLLPARAGRAPASS